MTRICLIALNITLRDMEGWDAISSQSLISVYRDLEKYCHSPKFYLISDSLFSDTALVLLELDALEAHRDPGRAVLLAITLILSRLSIHTLYISCFSSKKSKKIPLYYLPYPILTRLPVVKGREDGGSLSDAWNG